jgi:vacuolar protein sorting-associated protein 18
MEMQRKHGDTSKISKVFLDIHGDHLLVNTENGELFYFGMRNTRLARGRPISRINNIHIESIAWNADSTPLTTKEILIGTRDGAVLETYLEISDYIPNSRYLRPLKTLSGSIVGLHVEKTGEIRDVVVATPSEVTVYSGRIGRKQGDVTPVYGNFFDHTNSGQFQELSGASTNSKIAILPRQTSDPASGHAYYAWATSPGLFHGSVNQPSSSGDDSIFSNATLISYATLFRPFTKGKPVLPELSLFHILTLHENQLVAANRLNNQVVFTDTIPTVYLHEGTL